MQTQHSLSVSWWALDRVRPYDKNPRVITKAAIEKVAASVKEFGWRQPIVVDDDGIILVGHTRRAAAAFLGFTEVPVHVASGLSEAQKRAYRLADNRAGEESRWNPDLLDTELAELGALGFDLSKTGFDPIELPSIVPAFSPITSGEVQPLDRRMSMTCPQCGHVFERPIR
jgi:ParB-like chromosome segregation protein Spo0J